MRENLPLSRSAVDRRAPLRDTPGFIETLLSDDDTQVLLVDRGLLPLANGGDALQLLPASAVRDIDAAVAWVYLGEISDAVPVVALIVEHDSTAPVADGEGFVPAQPKDVLGESATMQSLRDMGHLLNASDVALAAAATALAAWHVDNQFCPRCGATTTVTAAGWSRECTQEGTAIFPRTDPAVIVAITDPDGRLLLARAAHWRGRRMSVLAGFVEAGESAEVAVRRELEEEVGITLSELNYFGSQPWPFPRSLMLGYLARTEHPEAMTPDGVEVVEARWFTRTELTAALAAGDVTLPMESSIARAMIDSWQTAGD